ncbi:hypothetical protein AMK21_00295 [Streptomyces sp. CB00316]|uniref:hypothetical protein n=1 Tax=unclassified Streptomyces TaxID=2593676 RepID=UPI00093D7180|nr:hypothetical protein AMK21_00295 [Streptomyces sp. CB00316]
MTQLDAGCIGAAVDTPDLVDPLLRCLLDERLAEGLTPAEAARLVHAHPAHLVRASRGARTARRPGPL